MDPQLPFRSSKNPKQVFTNHYLETTALHITNQYYIIPMQTQ
jgi:hypothetical protein